MDIEEIWPPYALHLQSGDMELSPVREDDLPELAELVRGGLRRNGVQAFLVDWDSGSDEQIARSLAQYHWGTRANFTVDDWTIEFTVRVSGRAVGVQGVTGRRFPLTHAVSTGSWLARTEQGRGFGTRARRTVIGAFIEHFDAARFDTGYMVGNEASRRVSEKLGYCSNGDQPIIGQNGEPQIEKKMVLHAEDYRPVGGEVVVTGAEEFRAFLGLPSRSFAT